MVIIVIVIFIVIVLGVNVALGLLIRCNVFHINYIKTKLDVVSNLRWYLMSHFLSKWLVL